MKLSLIVPIYNAEKYLKICLNSIVNQTYQDYEIILVDDGSTDNSGSICDQFASQDNRFRVIHKKNEGLIGARKTGIMTAKGDYIAFVDADDWIDPDFLESGMSHMEREAADIVITGCIKEKGKHSELLINKILPGIYDNLGLTHEVCSRMLHFEGFYEFGILPYIWNKFYKKSLLELCYKDIDLKIYDGEDVAVVYPYLLRTQKAVITQDAKYHYRIHDESMTAYKKSDYYENTARLYLYLAAKFQENTNGHDMMPQLDQYMRMMIWQGNPIKFMEAVGVIFPFKEIPKGARIILYGAGYVGRVFRYQLSLSEYCDVAAWVDKEYQRKELRQIGVTSLKILQTEEYDYVVIAVRDRDVGAEITSQLISYGVDRKKIVFCAQ